MGRNRTINAMECPACGSAMVYCRARTNDANCRRCGHVFKPKATKRPAKR